MVSGLLRSLMTKGEKFGQRYEMFWTKRYKGDESASMDMDQEGATLKNRGQGKHTSRGSKLMNLIDCI